MDHLYLAHHGIKGMKWGVRRFQNPDGSLTDAGKRRYTSPTKSEMKKDIKKARRAYRKQTGSWMVTGKNVANVDKKVSDELKSNLRRAEINAEREKLDRHIDKLDADAKNAFERSEDYAAKSKDESYTDFQRRQMAYEAAKETARFNRLMGDRDKAYKRYDELDNEYDEIGKEIANKHLSEYKNAVIADLGYEDISTGVHLLEEYGLSNYALRWDMYRSHGA